MDWLGPLRNLVPRLARYAVTWASQKIHSPLIVELPEPVNPMGRMSIGNGHYAAWNVKVRLLSSGESPLQILELRVTETMVGPWTIDELLDSAGRKIVLPTPVHGVCDVWLRARSPKSFQNLPFDVGPLTLQVRDHTQSPGHYRTCALTTVPTTVNR